MARVAVRRIDRPDGAWSPGDIAAIPGLEAMFKALTKVLPLGRGAVVERDGELFVHRID